MIWMPENAKLILNPTSGAPGFNVENVFCLPGVPSILKSMLGSLKNEIVGGEPILSHTINLRTVESEIANSLTKVQDNNSDVEVGSYPFFQAGKLGVSIVIRSEEQAKIDVCISQILDPYYKLIFYNEETMTERYAMAVRLKDEKRDFYIKNQAKVWPEVLSELKKIKVKNYSIYLKEDFMFGYLEYD